MPFKFHSITDAGSLLGKRVFLAVDLNVPIQDGRVIDGYRIERSRKTLDFLQSQGARTVLVSHRSDEAESLFPVLDYLKKHYIVVFATTIAEAKEKVDTAAIGSFVLLENIRKIAGDKEKKNDPAFAKELASSAHLYVNEAFSVSHRAHASIVGVPKFLPHYAGFLFEEEVRALSKAFSPAHPALLILGGAKFETKLPLIEKFLGITDDVYVCGALANDIYRARGYETGISLVSSWSPDLALIQNPGLHVPSDVVVKGRVMKSEKSASEVRADEKIVDAGTNALEELRSFINRATFVLWNGPLGEYESGFDEGTVAVAQMLAESEAESVVGGGDSLAVLSKLNLLERFSFVSTGGGAMLDFLANETLPGIEALQKA